MKKTFKYIGLSVLFVFITGSLYWLYSYHYTSEANHRESVDHSFTWGWADFDLLAGETVSYCDCKDDIRLVNTYKKGDFNVNFFMPMCRLCGVNDMLSEGLLQVDNVNTAGTTAIDENNKRGWSIRNNGCKKCSTMITVTDQQGNVVFTGVDDSYYPDGGDPSDTTKKIYSDQVYRVEMPDDFPYLVLMDTSLGSWGAGWNYAFYTTTDEFKLEYEFGPDWGYGDEGGGYDGSKGIYTDKDGNYMVDDQFTIYPPLGGWRSNALFKVPYRFNNKLEFKLATDYIKESVVTFTDDEIFRLLTNAKKFSKRITEAYIETLSKDENGEQEVSLQWPLELFSIWQYELYEANTTVRYNAHMYLLELIKNGRIDLANEYFYTSIPEEYDAYSILPKSLNTRAKLWEQYLLHLKEKSNLKDPSNRIIDKEASLWAVWDEISDGLLSKELNKYKTK